MGGTLRSNELHDVSGCTWSVEHFAYSTTHNL